MSKKTILIVDNSLINRTFLGGILSDEYEVVNAEDGAEALDILRSNDQIAAMLLDLMMPVMDGFQVLQAMREEDLLHNTPVIVVTAESETEAELKALDAGAWDFIVKPVEPEVARRRLRSAISRREVEELNMRNRVLEELRYQSDHDELTGVFSRSAFYRNTQAMLAEHPDEDFVLIRWDIEKFKLVNEIFGNEVGDAVLCAGARSFERLVEGSGTYGRYGSDNFVACFPQAALDPAEVMDTVTKETRDSFEDVGLNQSLVITTGVVEVTDHDLPVSQYCDRASMALETVKGDYNRHIAYYDDKLRDRLHVEQDILDHMEEALADGEFLAYFQPVYSLTSLKPVSAEALVRWKRDGKLISPGAFIPLFERNGFISKLDYCVWEQVCQVQARRRDLGLELIPISVNLSRKSAYNPHLYEDIVELVERYGVEPRLFRIEITESAYVDNANQLIAMVKRLQDYGFPVLMDDFGSGYSSFNILKDIPVDILKVDMRFMEGFESGGRVGVILTSILRMAKWLGMPVIAEGVETVDQARFLQSIDCDYTQGFLFAKPMPYDEFEAHLGADHPSPLGDDDLEGSSAADYEGVFSTALSSFAVVDYRGGELVTLRSSCGYERFGHDGANVAQGAAAGVRELVCDWDVDKLVAACKDALRHESPRELVLACKVGSESFQHVRFVIMPVGNVDGRDLLLVSITE